MLKGSMREKKTTAPVGSLLLCLLICITACQRGPKLDQKQWALATTGILTECNREYHDVLAGVEPTAENISKHGTLLSEYWGIKCREDLLFVLEWIEQVGHRKRFDQMGQYMRTVNDEEFKTMLKQLPDEDKSSWDAVRRYWRALGKKSLLGWDFCRYIHLCRKGYLLGYLSENEAWRLMIPKARILQQTFDSWKDLGENYLIGREFWSLARTRASGWFYYRAFKSLLENPDSPWNTIPWDLNLE
ncbi:hypothetical protein AMJ87_04665 [candidate division WOR_3 bacterium SM23_60]|uniref:DUF1266 domain-containing protein n=1 Tax=candidate division WOR_3 bacterium SM23_60 TaxID=1703780 RepID=A0A0S8GHK4_UNCW3|nr:MAG: hypothetical protein AMJ87_04665 [candidate division WOR_3 bacterium SM23_60]